MYIFFSFIISGLGLCNATNNHFNWHILRHDVDSLYCVDGSLNHRLIHPTTTTHVKQNIKTYPCLWMLVVCLLNFALSVKYMEQQKSFFWVHGWCIVLSCLIRLFFLHVLYLHSEHLYVFLFTLSSMFMVYL